MTKNEFRQFFAQCKPYLKLNTFCKECDIQTPALTHFVKGYDAALSEANLIKLYNYISDKLEKIA